MSKFTDTKYVRTIDSLVDAAKNKLVNPYYIYSDKKGTIVDYYSQNVEKSTLDPASGLYEAHLGDQSPFRFNKIKDFILYGIDRMSTEYDLGDDGIEANQISGDCVILPNTIVPKPGDFFVIKYLKEPLLFKVNGVSIDTLDTGANIYKLDYALEFTNSLDMIEKQIEKNFRFIPKNVGTEFKTVIQDCDYDLVDSLENLASLLTIFFENIFFDNKLQTFVYNYDGWHFYDPYMIEFLIRNKVFNYGDVYVYIAHATAVHKTFPMDYTKTFFYSLENPNITDINRTVIGTADRITDPNSLFSARNESYFSVQYRDSSPYKTRFNIFDIKLFDNITTNTYYPDHDPKKFYNLWIAYFNNNNGFIKSLNGDMLSFIKNYDYVNNIDCFYGLGISIFIIEKYIEKLMAI